MKDESEETSQRKIEHVMIAKQDDVDLSTSGSWFDHVMLLHYALPDASFDDVDLTWRFLGYELKAPLIIEGMTGGHEATLPINEALAEAAQLVGIAIGVGSQRAALTNGSVVNTYSIVREKASDVPVIANLGISHVLGEEGPENAKRAVDMIDADALAIHMNALQELLQPEGSTDFSNSLIAIRDVVRELDVPVIVKEVGAGISLSVAKYLVDVGVRIIDVAGVGGTSWALIEGERSPEGSIKREASRRFADWGIPTPLAILEVSRLNATIIGSGGVRSGLDAAKCIALGAEAAGAARPFFVRALEGGVEGVVRELKSFIYEMKIATFLTGSITPQQLRLTRKYVLTGPLKSLLDERHIFI
ncbi:MAG: type 2 isopentenyl-diphosphate Delta-isomerase [Candidatus Korarchaeota archaeon]|nr:type 2 isopentenyl-diphosphate Delta-isomerase [Candidatus Korarchaeota archaeon]